MNQYENKSALTDKDVEKLLRYKRTIRKIVATRRKKSDEIDFHYESVLANACSKKLKQRIDVNRDLALYINWARDIETY